MIQTTIELFQTVTIKRRQCPMSGFDTKWLAMQKANPSLADESAKVTLSIVELKRLLRKFYCAGEETVMPIAGGLEDLMNSIKKASGL